MGRRPELSPHLPCKTSPPFMIPRPMGVRLGALQSFRSGAVMLGANLGSGMKGGAQQRGLDSAEEGSLGVAYRG